MDVESFIKATPPRLPRSVITPYAQDVIRLRSGGYTLIQIREFLASNGVTVSIQAVSAWLSRNGKALARPKVPQDSKTSPSGAAVAPTKYVPRGRLSRADFEKFQKPSEDPE